MTHFLKKSRTSNWPVAFAVVIIIGLFLIWLWPKINLDQTIWPETPPTATDSFTTLPLSASSTEQILPPQKILTNNYIVYQTFNNCAPAALSMALSYFGINKSQEELADELRPYHNLTGKNDDKSTPPEELAAKAETYGLVAYYRPNGDIKTLKKILNLNTPIVVRALLSPDQDYAHYRVIKGYDDSAQKIIFDDSLEGKDQSLSYKKFLTLWRPFNFAYLVITPTKQQTAIEKILGEDLSPQTAWEHAAERALADLAKNQNDFDANFNLAVAYYYLRKFSDSAMVFEKIESRLTKHLLWYQNEPIKTYFELGNFEKVFSLTNEIFQDGNKAESELYLLRGQSLLRQSRISEAKIEFEKTLFYNVNSVEAKRELASLSETN